VRDYNNLVAVAKTAAERAASFIRSQPSPDADDWTQKTRHDFVTSVDRDAEQLIAQSLLSAVPGSAVVGEELTPGTRPDADIVWIVDPLDGTTNFLHGYPQYAVSIAAVEKDTLVAGVVYDVTRDSVFTAARGAGAWLGATRLRVSRVADPERALVGTGYPFKKLDLLDRYLAQFRTILRATSGIRRAGAAALDLADVAAGRLDCFWELSLAPWDVAAGVLLIREAGGVVTTIEGSEDVLRHGSVVAGNPAMHRWINETLNRAR
jgi:myo-inositol-1(or 4)-monophosphatase